jgi:hypothetical protein
MDNNIFFISNRVFVHEEGKGGRGDIKKIFFIVTGYFNCKS